MFQAAYLQLHRSGRLKERADALVKIYKDCTLCPRNCRVNRTDGKRGVCSAGVYAKISSAAPHFGEERPLVGFRGSGTIFFAHCNLLCVYCQNHDISHLAEGREIDDRQLAAVMLQLQGLGCHNINLVTPTHYLPNIINALDIAAADGLNVPIVYNTGNYENLEILRLLDGIIDIYLPDFKYVDNQIAAKYSAGADDYPQIAKNALKEMHRQVGILKTDDNNIAQRGLMIRHLVLPNDLAGTRDFVRFVKEELSPGTYVNIMAQYHACYNAFRFPELSRSLHPNEFKQAMNTAQNVGLYNLD